MIAPRAITPVAIRPVSEGRTIKLARRQAILFGLNQRTFALSALLAERVALVENKQQ
jgi:hypothetical protein